MAIRKKSDEKKGGSPAYRRIRKNGFQLGWSHGHWFGRCESIVKQATPIPVKRPIHVLYVTSGKGHPYSPLDTGIYETLRTVAEQVTLAHPDQDVEKIAQAAHPDMMLVLDGMQMPIEKVQSVSRQGIRTAVWFTDDPYYTDLTADIALAYHSVFTLERNCLPFYAERGCSRVFYLPLGVYPGFYRPLNPLLSRRGDVCFVGTAYWNRVQLLDEAIPMIANYKLYISGMWWDRLAEYERWKSAIDLGNWMEPIQTSETYNANKIVINIHRDHSDETRNQNSAMITAVSPNPRMFEVAASGTLQMSDRRDDISRFYIPDKEIILFDSPQDMAEKIHYYLAHEEERQSIALRGLHRTLKEHTYHSRLNELMDLTMQD